LSCCQYSDFINSITHLLPLSPRDKVLHLNKQAQLHSCMCVHVHVHACTCTHTKRIMNTVTCCIDTYPWGNPLCYPGWHHEDATASKTAVASLWGTKRSNYGTCSCRSPTDNVDTSKWWYHNCSCGMTAKEKITQHHMRIWAVTNGSPWSMSWWSAGTITLLTAHTGVSRWLSPMPVISTVKCNNMVPMVWTCDILCFRN
jgi:hypothetical protein